MSGILEGRAALVLGLDDVGEGIARRFAREGATLAAIDPQANTATIGGLVSGAAGDLGRLDVLVCNLLPSSHARPLADLDDPSIDHALGSVRGTLAAMRAALPWLRDSGRGRIVLIGHRYGESVGESLGAYNAAAWGLVGLARTAAVEWGPHQIATNVLVPLARTAEFEAARSRRPGVVDRLVDQLPLRRVGDPVEDIGAAAALLASDAMCWVNGEIVYADGGQHVAGPVLNPARFAT
jgi:3-oxoacyl-[acyl-carrier protein] reductase